MPDLSDRLPVISSCARNTLSGTSKGGIFLYFACRKQTESRIIFRMTQNYHWRKTKAGYFLWSRVTSLLPIPFTWNSGNTDIVARARVISDILLTIFVGKKRICLTILFWKIAISNNSFWNSTITIAFIAANFHWIGRMHSHEQFWCRDNLHFVQGEFKYH